MLAQMHHSTAHPRTHISVLRMCLRDLSQCGPVLPKRPAAALTEVDMDIFTARLERGKKVSAVVC